MLYQSYCPIQTIDQEVFIRHFYMSYLQKEAQMLLQKMVAFNETIMQDSPLIEKQQSKTVQNQPTSSEILTSNCMTSEKNELRKQCLLRYKAKKSLKQQSIVYQVRKIVADRRLRFNGQFLNFSEEQLVKILVSLLGGKHYLRVKNNNVYLIGPLKTINKEEAMKKLKQMMPHQIQKKILNHKNLFKTTKA